MKRYNNDEKPKNNLFFQFVIIIFYTSIFVKYYVDPESEISPNIFTAVYIFIGVLTTFNLYLKLNKNSRVFILITILFSISMIVSMFSRNFRIEDFVLVFTYTGISLIPVYYKLNYQLFKVFAYAIIAFFIIEIIRNVDPNAVFVISRNFISVVLLIGLGYHIISSFQNNKNPSLLIHLLSMIIAIWATGRGGIIATGILLLSFPVLLKIKTGYKFLILLLILSLSFIVYDNFNTLLYEFGLGRFNQLGIEDSRTAINVEYLSKSTDSGYNLFFGCPLYEVHSIVEVDNNPHNAYIRLHIFYGLFGFIILICAIIYTLFKYIKTKNYFFLMLAVALLFRSYVDSTAFHGPFDPLIYFLIFNSINENDPLFFVNPIPVFSSE